MAFLLWCSLKWVADEFYACCSWTNRESDVHQPVSSKCLTESPCHPPGDEGGESELLGEDLPLEPSVAKAERSHLIVWQVMYGSE